jgi:hypothetical protein
MTAAAVRQRGDRERHAEHQKVYRRRQRNGHAVLRVSADYYSLIEALLLAGRLTDDAAFDRRQVEDAASLVLADWVQRWREKA